MTPEASKLLEILEPPDDERWVVFVSRMFARDDGQALAEVLADEERPQRDTQERLIARSRAALDQSL